MPWTLLYITQLPDRHTTTYWSEAWTGFDVLLACALGFTAWCALRERALLIVGLIVSSTLLVCDAWFDVATSLGTGDEVVTLITALAIELPLALYFALLTRRLLVASVRASRPEYTGTALWAVPLADRPRRGARNRAPRHLRHELTTAANAAMARSRSSSEGPAESWMRMRAWPAAPRDRRTRRRTRRARAALGRRRGATASPT